ncbi:hypothetical protein COOONC_10717, partial [Cooperia oncophora]
MNMLRAMILPLIVASLVSGVSMLDGRTAGKLSTRSFIYYGGATLHAVLLGIVIATVIHPGDPTIKEGLQAEQALPSQGRIVDKIGDVLRNIFTENLIRSMFQQQQTIYKLIESNVTEEQATRALVWTDGM